MSKVKLAPCPFCGGPGKTYTDVQRDIDCAGTRTVWRVRCGAREDCALLMAHFPTEEDAIAAWNTRGGDRTINLY
ncbi:MAG: Lar family restriction alleviation protein [Synergistaceae bacterium]|nr:Lar family restriction alleviation protein [Synergistaceae bacterium]